MSWRRLSAFALLVPLAATGCTSMLVESVVDETLSAYAEADCAAKNLLFGEAICDRRPAAAPPPVYCYNTLGDVECYDVPDPGGRRAAGPTVEELERREAWARAGETGVAAGAGKRPIWERLFSED